MPKTEAEMVDAAIAVLRRQSVEHATEVPILHRSIDLVFRDGHDFVAVEFKRRDWRRGLLQAQDHALAADRVYLCLPPTRITNRLKREATTAGVGILSWTPDNPLRTVAVAPRSNLVWSVTKGWLAERLSFCRQNDL